MARAKKWVTMFADDFGGVLNTEYVSDASIPGLTAPNITLLRTIVHAVAWMPGPGPASDPYLNFGGHGLLTMFVATVPHLVGLSGDWWDDDDVDKVAVASAVPQVGLFIPAGADVDSAGYITTYWALPGGEVDSKAMRASGDDTLETRYYFGRSADAETVPAFTCGVLIRQLFEYTA